MSDTSTMTREEIEARSAAQHALWVQTYMADWRASEERRRRARDAEEKWVAKWGRWQIVGIMAFCLLAPYAMAAGWVVVWKALGLWKQVAAGGPGSRAGGQGAGSISRLTSLQALKRISFDDDTAIAATVQLVGFIVQKVEDANKAIVAQLTAQTWSIGAFGTVTTIFGFVLPISLIVLNRTK